jgi:hypothetical protein
MNVFMQSGCFSSKTLSEIVGDRSGFSEDSARSITATEDNPTITRSAMKIQIPEYLFLCRKSPDILLSEKA